MKIKLTLLLLIFFLFGPQKNTKAALEDGYQATKTQAKKNISFAGLYSYSGERGSDSYVILRKLEEGIYDYIKSYGELTLEIAMDGKEICEEFLSRTLCYFGKILSEGSLGFYFKEVSKISGTTRFERHLFYKGEYVDQIIRVKDKDGNSWDYSKIRYFRVQDLDLGLDQ